MLALILILAVFLVILTVVLWAGTLSLQGLIYSEPTEDLHWRAPTTAAAVTLFISLWCYLDYQTLNPNAPELPLDTLFRFQPRRTEEVSRLWAVKVPQEVAAKKATDGTIPETIIEYTRRGPGDYRDNANRPWQRADPTGIVWAVLIEENNQKVRFQTELDHEGRFVNTATPFPGYREVGGRRVMDELGQISIFRYQLWLANIFFNALHLGLWFAGLWLLLRFQWPHALGLAVVSWLVMTLFLLPLLLTRTQEAARLRAQPSPPPAVSFNCWHCGSAVARSETPAG